MTGACDEQSPGRGGEKEEPNEPPPPGCYVRIIGGSKALPKVDELVRAPYYEYNSKIAKTGYMVKPVHKVYRRLSNGSRKVYVYYGRYWWKRKGKRFVYSGTEKPRKVKIDPPSNPLSGLSIIVVDDDIIVSCSDYEKLKCIFEGFKVVREE